MKLFNRRSALKGAPVAAIGAATFAKTATQPGLTPALPPSPTSVGGIGTMLNKCGSGILDAARVPTPLELLENAKRKKFFQAKDAAETVWNKKRYLVHGNMQPNMNIQALRSVSHQHKMHMQMEWEQREQDTNETWLEKLASNIGFSWNPRPNHSYDNATPPEPARNSRY